VKRILVAALLSLALSGATVGAVGAAPAPSFSAVLTSDSSCAFTLKASWKNTTIDTVFGIWYYDNPINDINSIFTTQAPFPGPNGGTIRGRTATMHAGPATLDTASHSWRVLVQFYRGGAFQYQMEAATVAPCAV
jgi:hypothetical protein